MQFDGLFPWSAGFSLSEAITIKRWAVSLLIFASDFACSGSRRCHPEPRRRRRISHRLAAVTSYRLCATDANLRSTLRPVAIPALPRDDKARRTTVSVFVLDVAGAGDVFFDDLGRAVVRNVTGTGNGHLECFAHGDFCVGGPCCGDLGRFGLQPLCV